MPLTYSNRVVNALGTSAPSLVDIAIGLSRQPRFAGQTRVWWSVLDHSLFCDLLVQKDTGTDPHGLTEGTRMWRIAMLLHDAHEALTADVPTPFKGSELKDVQHALDVKIMNAFMPGGHHRYQAWGNEVARIDRRALLAEAQVIGAPVALERITDLFPPGETTGDDAAFLDGLAWSRPNEIGSILGIPPLRSGQENHPAVQRFLALMLVLL